MSKFKTKVSKMLRPDMFVFYIAALTLITIVSIAILTNVSFQYAKEDFEYITGETYNEFDTGKVEPGYFELLDEDGNTTYRVYYHSFPLSMFKNEETQLKSIEKKEGKSYHIIYDSLNR